MGLVPYRIEITPGADGELTRLDPQVARRVRDKIDWMAENADSLRHEPMTGQYRGSFRLRVGNYRVLYELDRANRHISVRKVGHRREIYD